MSRAASLRTRLTLIILLPLLAVAVLAGVWQLNNAQRTAADVFNKSLLSAALAVANDVAISGGDALSARTRDILSDTSGGQVFYHVYAPDGVIVAGYATPPVGIPATPLDVASPVYFDATYLGQTVSGVRLQNRTEIEGFAGIFTTTVWQDTGVRAAFVRDLILRSLVTITGLIASVAFIVWFGVRIGLAPLLDLEAAIAQRSSDELNPIQRAVPTEVGGIVQTLNRLFDQVSRSMTAQNEFISNAAHQLRNPIAGVLSLAEAVHDAPSPEDAKKRSGDLLAAARETADLTQQLLTLERAKTISPEALKETVDVAGALDIWVDGLRGDLPDRVTVEVAPFGHLGKLT
ncbi:MAG: sensor histidine kinase, partial [Pseudomonadota bacterium]